MTDLNEFECEMLDALLEAFGIPDSLTRENIMELFDQDEAAAFSMVQVLMREGLVAGTGEHGPFDLPQKLVLKPKGEKFLKEGGFTQRFKAEQQKPVEVGGTLAKLQQQNMRLQNLRLTNETEISELKKKLTAMQTKQYLWYVLIFAALVVGYLLGHHFKK